MNAGEVEALRSKGYNSWDFYHKHPPLKKAIDMIKSGFFSKSKVFLFKPIIESLLDQGDIYMLLADYKSYIDCQQQVSKTYKNKKQWTRMSICNVASTGKFSSDRTISEYAKDIWKVTPVQVTIPGKE
jgi:glycogen phosphorylase